MIVRVCPVHVTEASVLVKLFMRELNVGNVRKEWV